jgi:AcrR family transcriptional regulator
MAGMAQRRAGRPRDVRLEAAIVAATVRLLEQRGYNDLSLAAVAARAGTTTPAIYRRWGSKAELVTQAVFRTEGDDVVAETDDVATDIATMVRWSVQKICRPAALAAIAGILGAARTERGARGASATMASRRLTARLERAQAAGELRADVDVRVLAATIAGPVLYASLVGGGGAVNRAWIDGLVTVILDGARPRPTDAVRTARRRGGRAATQRRRSAAQR